MLPLAELQQCFARAVIDGTAPAGLFGNGVPPAAALAVHRDTVMGALVNALRLSHPTVDALVGEAFFDHAACAFAESNPPAAASLADYGGGFADFLASFAPVLPYLPDAARLDRAVEIALRAPVSSRRFPLDPAVSIDLPQSLVVLRLAYPADEIRAALGDDLALAAIVPVPAERFVLVWRTNFEAAVRRVAPAAGHFLASLLAGDGAGAAFYAAAGAAPPADVSRAIQDEIFAAPFCTVISNSEKLLS